MESLAVGIVVALALVVSLVGALAMRNRIFFKLGIRNVTRRRARSALIVLGLMLGTTIIAAALATGDTMSHTIRSSAIASLGHTDERISVQGAEFDTMTEAGSATGELYMSDGQFETINEALKASPLVDGVAPAIIETVAVQNGAARQNEPRVTLFAADPEHMDGLGPIVATSGEAVSLADLARDQVFLNAE